MVWPDLLFIDFKKRGFKNIIIRNREELDLTIQYEVENFFKKVKPDYVI